MMDNTTEELKKHSSEWVDIYKLNDLEARE